MAHTTDYLCLNEGNLVQACTSTLSIKTYAYYLFVLKEHLRWFMGKHYPKEIFEMILLRINIPVTLNYGIASSAIVKNPYYASSKKNMYAMLCLNKWVGDNFGNNYPRELVHMISTIAYKPIKIQCGWYWMKIFVATKFIHGIMNQIFPWYEINGILSRLMRNKVFGIGSHHQNSHGRFSIFSRTYLHRF